MNSEILDEVQMLALKPEVCLVEAGPGAGKTRTIVERMKRHRSGLHKGVALISFTNTAADEAKRRCSTNLLASPNFVGTIDSFLHKFVVTPAILVKRGTAPRYLTSWNELPEAASRIHLAGVSGPGFRLSSFKMNANGYTDVRGVLSQDDQMYRAICSKAGCLSDLVALGHQQITHHLDNRVFDSDSARLRALDLLADEDDMVGQQLASRFDEIIIDEFQDCSDVEVQIVEKLKAFGINVVVVADPDQAIYEFRDASPDSYRNYRDTLDKDSIVYLERNYRSSPAICEMVAALRSVGSGRVVSNSPENQKKIVVVAGSHKYQRDQFGKQLADQQIGTEDSIILAHKRRKARETAGLPTASSLLEKSVHKTFHMLGGVIAIKLATGPYERKVAIDRVQRIVLSLINWNHGEKGLDPAAQLELLDITRSCIASFLLDLRRKSSFWTDRSSATGAIRTTTESHFGELSRALKKPTTALSPLTEQHWKVWIDSRDHHRPEEVLWPYSHIHAVKGNEYEAVLLSVEKQHRKDAVWDMIQESRSDESLRVLYVGASRAASLLTLACTAKEASKLTAVLDEKQVAYELFKEKRA